MKGVTMSVLLDDGRWDVFFSGGGGPDWALIPIDEAIKHVRDHLKKHRTNARRKYTLWIRDVATAKANMVLPVVSVGYKIENFGAVRVGVVKYDDIADTLEAHMRMMETM